MRNACPPKACAPPQWPSHMLRPLRHKVRGLNKAVGPRLPRGIAFRAKVAESSGGSPQPGIRNSCAGGRLTSSHDAAASSVGSLADLARQLLRRLFRDLQFAAMNSALLRRCPTAGGLRVEAWGKQRVRMTQSAAQVSKPHADLEGIEEPIMREILPLPKISCQAVAHVSPTHSMPFHCDAERRRGVGAQGGGGTRTTQGDVADA
ncbi:hypothetical protein MRB53_041483 [Persea americana]|nr:hypothetical protein MRB53_041483 [Persea americana]